ncbi:MAG: type IV pilin protein [Inhella sp.]
MRKSQAGFSLVELMIAVAIVGVLAAVAIPSYRDYVRRGQIPDALAALSDYRIKLETYYQDYRNYGVGNDCAVSSSAAWKNFTAPAGSKFAYKCATTDSGQGFLLTATGKTGSAVAGHEYTLDHNNSKVTVSFKGAASGKACWLVNGSEC